MIIPIFSTPMNNGPFMCFNKWSVGELGKGVVQKKKLNRNPKVSGFNRQKLYILFLFM